MSTNAELCKHDAHAMHSVAVEAARTTLPALRKQEARLPVHQTTHRPLITAQRWANDISTTFTTHHHLCLSSFFSKAAFDAENN
jgi:hypothetical protein